MKKNLVIHPSDISTTFLTPIYRELKNSTVIEEKSSYDEVLKKCQENNRVLMMGHGSPQGLFSVGRFGDVFWMPYIIDYMHVPVFRKQDENVYIWCDANQFVEKYKLKGFYTGMFISEVSEAAYCGLGVVSKSLVEQSNNAFSEILSKYVNHSKQKIYDSVKKEYEIIANDNIVAAYNHSRLYYL